MGGFYFELDDPDGAGLVSWDNWDYSDRMILYRIFNANEINVKSWNLRDKEPTLYASQDDITKGALVYNNDDTILWPDVVGASFRNVGTNRNVSTIWFPEG